METLKKLLMLLNEYRISNIKSLFDIRYSIFIFFLILPFQISLGCGPYHLTFEGYTFMNPNIVNTKATYAPYFLRFNDLYNSPD
ncbi:MAG: hypothetical protein AB8H03_11860, partial [Saprospiraceae bacterium]